MASTGGWLDDGSGNGLVTFGAPVVREMNDPVEKLLAAALILLRPEQLKEYYEVTSYYEWLFPGTTLRYTPNVFGYVAIPSKVTGLMQLQASLELLWAVGADKFFGSITSLGGFLGIFEKDYVLRKSDNTQTGYACLGCKKRLTYMNMEAIFGPHPWKWCDACSIERYYWRPVAFQHGLSFSLSQGFLMLLGSGRPLAWQYPLRLPLRHVADVETVYMLSEVQWVVDLRSIAMRLIEFIRPGISYKTISPDLYSLALCPAVDDDEFAKIARLGLMGHYEARLHWQTSIKTYYAIVQ